MIYVRFIAGGKTKHGILDRKTVCEIAPHFYGPFRKTGKKYPLAKVTLVPPCQPGKIVALGLNYLDHAREMKMPIPLQPLLFLKATSAIIGPGERIVCPAMSRRVDYEAELAIVIKKKVKNVAVSRAQEYILGYTCFNDVTARDLQKIDGQWARAKSFDTFAPIGPWIVDEIDSQDLKIETRLNGKIMQNSSTKELIFNCNEIVAFVSQVMTLMPGDVIATGTPPGVGPMQADDRVEVRIEHIGSLINTVV
ncbi:MAG: fumarylacetoacetate hydrolase family protein [Elusimicrobia bacterium]|nr:fumarylacetoacetate hydrolase family protein [Elusimicrobiota bacterium]